MQARLAGFDREQTFGIRERPIFDTRPAARHDDAGIGQGMLAVLDQQRWIIEVSGADFILALLGAYFSAAVTPFVVPVVAFFRAVGLLDAVATERGFTVIRALIGVHRIAVVALLSATSGNFTVPADDVFALARTRIRIPGVSIVALFHFALDDAVSTDGVFAFVRARIRIDGIAVIAFLTGIGGAVSAEWRTDGRRHGTVVRTFELGFHRAARRAAVSVGRIAVITRLREFLGRVAARVRAVQRVLGTTLTVPSIVRFHTTRIDAASRLIRRRQCIPFGLAWIGAAHSIVALQGACIGSAFAAQAAHRLIAHLATLLIPCRGFACTGERGSRPKFSGEIITCIVIFDCFGRSECCSPSTRTFGGACQSSLCSRRPIVDPAAGVLLKNCRVSVLECCEQVLNVQRGRGYLGCRRRHSCREKGANRSRSSLRFGAKIIRQDRRWLRVRACFRDDEVATFGVTRTLERGEVETDYSGHRIADVRDAALQPCSTPAENTQREHERGCHRDSNYEPLSCTYAEDG